MGINPTSVIPPPSPIVCSLERLPGEMNVPALFAYTIICVTTYFPRFGIGPTPPPTPVEALGGQHTPSSYSVQQPALQANLCQESLLWGWLGSSHRGTFFRPMVGERTGRCGMLYSVQYLTRRSYTRKRAAVFMTCGATKEICTRRAGCRAVTNVSMHHGGSSFFLFMFYTELSTRVCQAEGNMFQAFK